VSAGAPAVRLMHDMHLILQCLPLMQLEEKRIPYIIEKINMRCYGDKPPSFLAKVNARLWLTGWGPNPLARTLLKEFLHHHLLEVSWWGTAMSITTLL